MGNNPPKSQFTGEHDINGSVTENQTLVLDSARTNGNNSQEREYGAGVGPIDILVKTPLAKELRIQVLEKPVTAFNYD